jgi:hypothetical protein
MSRNSISFRVGRRANQKNADRETNRARRPATAGDLSVFKSPLDNSPMTFPLSAGEVETPAVKNFMATGVNE